MSNLDLFWGFLSFLRSLKDLGSGLGDYLGCDSHVASGDEISGTYSARMLELY